MPKYVIERSLPGPLSEAELKKAVQSSGRVLQQMQGKVQWVHSYVTDGKIYCVYNAPSAEEVRKHAQMAGLPCDQVSEVRDVIDPTTFES
jgi:hypothetical protein